MIGLSLRIIVCGVGSRNIFPDRLANRFKDTYPRDWYSIGHSLLSTGYTHTGSLCRIGQILFSSRLRLPKD
jgi:hypothetical protein